MKLVRNCRAYFVSRSATIVYYRLHFSDQHVWDMPATKWDAIDDFVGQSKEE